MENQLTKMLDKYPHLREEKQEGYVLEILLEDDLNGADSAMRLNKIYVRGKLKKLKNKPKKIRRI